MALRDTLLPIVDAVRGKVPGMLGLRPWTVTVRVRTWSGERPGLGTRTDVDTVITNAGAYSPKVTEVSSRDIVASGGIYSQGDYRIGPISPEYATGGTAPASLDPATTTTAREVWFKLEGRGFPSEGAWCKRVDSQELKPFHTEVVVRKTAAIP